MKYSNSQQIQQGQLCFNHLKEYQLFFQKVSNMISSVLELGIGQII